MGKCFSRQKSPRRGKSNHKEEENAGSRRPTVIERADAAGDHPSRFRRKLSGLSTYSTASRHVLERPPRVGAFNVRRFGAKKMSDPAAVDVLVRIALRYDVLLVQEIVDVSGKAIDELLDLCQTSGISGSLLLAHEGINGTIAGPRHGIDAVLAEVRANGIKV